MVYERAKHKNSVAADTLMHVQQFYTRDDNSRMSSGKKQTLTRKKVKMQKTFLLDTVVNLHEKFKSEYPSAKISYSMFAKLRPFWVVNQRQKTEILASVKYMKMASSQLTGYTFLV